MQEQQQYSLSTHPSLLIRVRDPRDGQAWRRFVEIYTPFIHDVCRRRGLQAADTADVVQEVMRRIAQAIPRFDYDPARGAFRSWLFSITRTSINDLARKARRQPEGSGQSTVQQLLDSHPAAEEGDDELHSTWQQHVLECALNQVRGEFELGTWQAFWETTIHRKPVQEVAQELNRSVGAIYVARSRVMARLRLAIREVDDQVGEG